MKPVRQQHTESMVHSSGVKAETRSSYNIYKRNSDKIAKNSEGVDLNKGLVLSNNDSCSPLREAHMQSFEVSDTQLHHAASQSTLNLEARSPFSQVVETTPNSVIAKFNNIEAASYSDSHKRKRYPLCFATNAQNVGTAAAPRKYEAFYNEYINGKCEDEALIVPSGNEQAASRNHMSELGKKSAGELGKWK